MNFSRRNELIWRMKKDGISNRCIAERFGISRARVGAICKTIAERNNWPEFRRLLSVRVQNVLLTYFKKNEKILENPQRIAEFGTEALRSLRNMEKKSVQEVADALRGFGFSLKTYGNPFPDPDL